MKKTYESFFWLSSYKRRTLKLPNDCICPLSPISLNFFGYCNIWLYGQISSQISVIRSDIRWYERISSNNLVIRTDIRLYGRISSYTDRYPVIRTDMKWYYDMSYIRLDTGYPTGYWISGWILDIWPDTGHFVLVISRISGIWPIKYTAQPYCLPIYLSNIYLS